MFSIFLKQNKKLIHATLLTLFFVFAFSAFFIIAHAATNPQINYQGKLTDDTGATVANGSYTMEFKLYTQASGGVAIWTETLSGGTAVPVSNGLFSIMLGSSTSLIGVNFNQTLYLGVNIAGDGEMTPRKVLGSVPASFEARRLEGVASSSFVRSDQADTIAATTASTLLTITQSGTGDILNLFDAGTEVLTVLDGGNVGIGTSTPSRTLTVADSARITGALYDSQNSPGTNGMVLQSTATGQRWVATSTLGISGGGGGSGTVNTGAAGYFAYYPSGGTTVDDQTVLNLSGTKIGIGTTTPNRLLDVYGIAAVVKTNRSDNTNGYAAFDSTPTGAITSSNVVWGAGLYPASNNYTIWSFDSSTNTKRLEITNTGNIGIGSSSPSAKLSVHAKVGETNKKLFSVASSTASATSTFFVVTNTGDVGIGTTDPLAALDVHANAGTNAQIKLTDDDVSHGMTAVTSASAWARFTPNHSTKGGLAVEGYNDDGTNIGLSLNGFLGSSTPTATMPAVMIKGFKQSGTSVQALGTNETVFDVRNNNTVLMRVLGSGNIGIGTSTPSRKLTVGGAGYFGGSLTATGTLAVSGTGTSTIAGGLQLTGATGANALQFSTDVSLFRGSADILSLASGDSFNIVNGSLTMGGNTAVTNGSIFRSGSGGSAPAPNFTFQNDNNTGMFASSGIGADNLAFTTAGSERLRIDASGNVGIGTTSPTNNAGYTNLSLNNATNGGLMTLQSAGADRAQFYTDGSMVRLHSLGAIPLILGTSGSEIMRLTSSGNVGIGTSTPSLTLTVAGTMRITGALYDSQNSPGTNGMVLQSTATGQRWVATSTLGLGGGGGGSGTVNTGASGFFAYYPGTGTTVDDQTILNIASNNIGIGTSTPSSKLSVVGTAGSTQDIFSVASSTNTKLFNITGAGRVGIGSTSPQSLLTIDKNAGLSGSIVAGIKERLTFNNTTASVVYYGDNAYIVNAPTATSTLVGKILRIEDNTALGNIVRGLEVQANRGTNTNGENTGISGFGRTFGVRGTTDADAGGTYEPAGLYGETRGTTQGNAIRGYSGNITTANLMSLYQDTSAFRGTGLLMNFGNSGGTFSSTTSKFIDLQKAGSSQFVVMHDGRVGIGTTSPLSPLHVAASSTNLQFILDNLNASTTNQKSQISFRSKGIENWSMGIDPTANGTSDFFIYKAYPGSRPLTIKSTGNVGIGTTSPANLLHLNGSGSSMGIAFTNTSNTAGKRGFRMNNDNDRLTIQSTTDAGVFAKNIMNFNHAGNVGINDTAPAYRLTVASSTASSYVARIYNSDTSNTADGLLISLGVANASRAATNRFIDFSDGAGTVAGKIAGGASAVAFTTTAADLAEYFPVHSSLAMPIEGEIVALDPNHDNGVMVADENSIPFGIVSTNPGFVGNGPLCKSGNDACDQAYDNKNALVSLVGQVPLKVSNENGEIVIGDSITISSTDGVGMKANFGDTAIGYALEPNDENDATSTIRVFANLHTALGMNPDPQLLTDVDGQNEEDLTGKTIMNRMVQLVSGFVDGVLQVAGLRTNELCIDDDNGTTCIDRGDLEALIQNAEISNYADDGGGNADEDTGGENEGEGTNDTDRGTGTTTPDVASPPGVEPPTEPGQEDPPTDGESGSDDSSGEGEEGDGENGGESEEETGGSEEDNGSEGAGGEGNESGVGGSSPPSP